MAIGGESLVALVFLDLDAIVVSLRYLESFLGRRSFEDEVLKTIKERIRKSKGSDTYREEGKNYSVFKLDKWHEVSGICHFLRGRI